MFTITIGVLDDYSNEDFYSKERNFLLEKQRVDQKFKNSSQLGNILFKYCLSNISGKSVHSYIP